MSNPILEECKVQNVYPFDFFQSKPFYNLEIGQEYTLNGNEVAWSQRYGPRRTQAARQAGRMNMMQAAACGSPKEKFMEINGIQAELLYGKMFNLYPGEQFEIRPRAVSEDYGDFVHQGFRMDVKATEYPHGRLTLGSWKAAEHIDALCLFTGQDGRFTFRGFYTAKELAQPQNFKCLPGRDEKQYIMDQSRLMTFEAVVERLKNVQQAA